MKTWVQLIAQGIAAIVVIASVLIIANELMQQWETWMICADPLALIDRGFICFDNSISYRYAN